MADSVPDGSSVGDGAAKEKKKKRSVKKTKDTTGSVEGDRKSDDGAEVPSVDDGDNVAPTIVEGQLNPEILEAIKATAAEDENKKEVITAKQEPPATRDSNAGGMEMPLDADKGRAKEASPSAAAQLAHDILSPVMVSLPPESDEPYRPPTAVEAGDLNALQELDERKIIELREAFNLFDLDHDGCIDANDLKSTFQTLGVDVADDFIETMLADAMDPLDFESFVLMYGIKTIEMDPESVLLEALMKWDKERTGQISIERMKHDLMSFGNKFSEEEATAALQEVPLVKGTGDAFGCTGPLMFDYFTFCQKIGGFRKRRKQDPVFIY